MKATLGVIAFVLLAGAGAAAVASGQTTAAPATLEALLAEVRGLRADVNHAAGTSIRAQLLMSRLQLQEQRVSTLAKQLTDVQTQRSGMETGIAQMAEHAKRLEEMSRNSSLAPEVVKQAQGELAGSKPQMDMMRQQLQRLTDQESALSGQLATEQAHWIEFNTRLDEIERETREKQ